MKYLSFFLVSSILISAACTFSRSTVETPAQDDLEGMIAVDYEVISSYLNLTYRSDSSPRKLLICSDTINSEHDGTSTDNSFASFDKRSLSEIGNDLRRSFVERNGRRFQLNRALTITMPYEYLSRAAIQEIGSGTGGFGEFEKKIKDKFPEAHLPLYFSNIGYNATKTKAIFFMIRSMRDGSYVVMTRESGKWVIESEQGAWIA